MNKLKRRTCKIFGFSIAITVILTLATSCSNSEKVSKDDQLETITILNYINADYSLDDNPVLKEIEKKAKVKLKIEAPPINNYWERLSIIMASLDLPDLIHLSPNDSYQKYATEGLIIPIDDYIVKYPNIKNTISQDHLDMFKVPNTGKIHAIPRVHRPNTWVGIIRKDWLERVGLEVPNTKEEFINVMNAFTNKDPDGNGANDTYGLSLRSINDLQDSYWTGVFGLRPLSIADENGKVTIHEAQSGYFEMLDFFRQMYAEKSLDPEFYLNKGVSDMTKFEQSKLGFVAKWTKLSDAYTLPSIANIKEIVPNADFSIVMPLENSDGKRRIYDIKSIMGGFSITKSCEKPDVVLKFIDWGLSEEGLKLMNLGIKGITFESYDDDTRVRKMTEENKINAKKYLSSYQTFTVMKGDLPLISPVDENGIERYFDDVKKYSEEVTYVTVKMDNSIPGYSDLKLENADIIKKRDENMLKYVMGMISKDEMLKFINEQYIPKNQKIIDAAQRYYDQTNK